MCGCDETVSLGFTPTRYPRGVHVCHLFNDDREREEVMARFLASGVDSGDLMACFTDTYDADELTSHLAAIGVDAPRHLGDGRLRVHGASAFYFRDGCFDPDIMLDGLRRFHQDAAEGDYPGARVIGEMSPTVQTVRGAERLAEYEARVNDLSATHPVTAICQYDTRLFTGEVIMDVLAVHPLMIRNGWIVENPFYVTPDQYLGRSQAQAL